MANRKLNPPILESIIPSFFTTTVGELLVTNMVIPFRMNRSVGRQEISGIKIKLKTIGGFELGIWDIDKNGQIDFDNNIIRTTVPGDIAIKLNIGQYYKIQIAYIEENDSTIGYYSSVGVIKYTAKPEVELEQQYDVFIGTYRPSDEDKTEKWYSYKFDLIKIDGDVTEVIDTTGEVLQTNIERETEEFLITKNLDENYEYKVSFTATSVNKHEFFEERKVSPIETEEEPDYNLIVKNNYDNGYCTIKIEGQNLLNEDEDFYYVLLRNSSKNGEDGDWCVLDPNFHLEEEYRDFTVEHGVNYTYALQGVYTEIDEEGRRVITKKTKKKLSEEITTNFEDIFLTDKDRQLKIKFNPKVSGYKRNVLETKLETIGGKYPIIVRNGNVDYKEINIGGLVSYLSDEEGLFFLKLGVDESHRQDTESTKNDPPHSSTATSDENIFKERLFREAVLKWLTNGQPKYYRSNTEGNHIVRLLNVSLSPNDTLGRMIYSFSANVYEVAEDTRENLIKNGIVKEEE